MPAVIEIKEIPVLSYHLASADMRYIETGVRDIYLREDPDLGLVYRGEIPDCGPACYVGLNEILLEYAMSCEGCKEETTAAEEVSQFGVRLGEILLTKMQLDTLDLATTQKLLKGFEPIFNSMSAVYEIELQEDRLGVSLRCCPLSECAKTTGLGRNVELAYISFTALCTTLIGVLAPDWVLLQPTEGAVQLPLHDIVIVSP